MNLSKVSDKNLIESVRTMVKEERELLARLLHHLKEIERRRLFSVLGFRSMYEYVTRGLGYSEDQAYRRIQAMRLLQEIPELEKKIEAGSLSLSHISVAQKLFRSQPEPMSHDEKVEFFQRLENTTKREAEKLIVSLSPTALNTPDQIKTTGEATVEVRFSADQALAGKIEKLKGLLAHSNPNLSLAELVDKLCELGLDKWDPARKITRGAVNSAGKSKRQLEQQATLECGTPEKNQAAEYFQNGQSRPKAGQISAPARVNLRSEKQRPSISVGLKRAVWKRDGSRCSQCGSIHALQIDHCQPVALGGSNDLGNLRLLCRACNQRKAIQSFGQQQMGIYLRV